MSEKGKEEYQRYSESVEKSKDKVSRILLTHLYLENLLERYISAKIGKPDRLFGKNGLSFKQKSNLAWSFNELSDQQYDSINKVNSIRNDYAHKFGYDAESSVIQTLGKTLGKAYKEITNSTHDEDEVLCIILARISGELSRLASDAEEEKT